MIDIQSNEYRKPYILFIKDSTWSFLQSRVFWVGHGFFFRVMFIFNPLVTIMNFLKKNNIWNINAYIALMLEFSILLLGLLVNFNIFSRNNQLSLYPDKHILTNSIEIAKMFLYVNMSMFFTTSIISIQNKFMILHNKMAGDTDYFYYIGFFCTIWLIISKIIEIKRINHNKIDLYDMYHIAGSASGKIKKRLSLNEQNEMKRLIFELEKDSVSLLKDIAYILSISIFFAMAIQVAQITLGNLIRRVL